METSGPDDGHDQYAQRAEILITITDSPARRQQPQPDVAEVSAQDLPGLSDLDLIEQFNGPGKKALLTLQPVNIRLTAGEAFVVFMFLQIAVTHPQSRGFYADLVKLVAGELDAALTPASPVLAEVARRGWIRIPGGRDGFTANENLPRV